MLAIEYLRERLHYNPETGVFTWRRRSGSASWLSSWNSRYAGTVAGAANKRGYIAIEIDGVGYLAHRLAWLYETGSWPRLDVDHRDTVKTNNSFANLREATESQNGGNATRSARNSSGAKGVTFNKRLKKFHARIQVKRQSIHLGFYEKLSEAKRAYAAASEKYYGEFGRAA